MDIFNAWIIQDLIPQLPKNSVIIMDIAAFHKGTDMQQAIANKGHTLKYRPTYSFDLTPIEHKWAHAKELRRKHHCNIETLFQKYITSLS